MNIFLPRLATRRQTLDAKQGFTLIELLVVIGVLTVLLAIVLVAINPARQFSQANDTQRRSDVNAILNAIHQFAADNKGTLPTDIATTSKVISSTGTPALCGNLVPKYIADIPIDPTAGTEARRFNLYRRLGNLQFSLQCYQKCGQTE